MKNIYMEYGFAKRKEANLPLGTIEDTYIIKYAAFTKHATDAYALKLELIKLRNETKKYTFGILGEEVFTPFLEEMGMNSKSVKATIDSIIGEDTTIKELEKKCVTVYIHPNNYVKGISVPKYR